MSASTRALRSYLTTEPIADIAVLRSLASPLRLRILQLLKSEGGLNVHDVSRILGLPQSATATKMQLLERPG